MTPHVPEFGKAVSKLDRSSIHVVEYLTTLPSRKVLSEKLHLAALRARQQLNNHVFSLGVEAQTTEDRIRAPKGAKKRIIPKESRSLVMDPSPKPISLLGPSFAQDDKSNAPHNRAVSPKIPVVTEHFERSCEVLDVGNVISKGGDEG